MWHAELMELVRTQQWSRDSVMPPSSSPSAALWEFMWPVDLGWPHPAAILVVESAVGVKAMETLDLSTAA